MNHAGCGEGSKPLFLEMGMTVCKQTNAHLLGFQTLRGNTSKNEFSVLHFRHLSGPILQSLLLSAQDFSLPHLKPSSPKLFLRLQPECHCSERREGKRAQGAGHKRTSSHWQASSSRTTSATSETPNVPLAAGTAPSLPGQWTPFRSTD